MSDSLDGLLASADPAASYDDRLDPLLREVATNAEDLASRRRRTVRRAGIVGSLTGVFLAAGGVGVATGLFSTAPEPESGDWLTSPGTVAWTATMDSGATCEVTFAVMPDDLAGKRLGLDANEWRAVLDAAREVVASIDVADIDAEAAAARWRRESEAARQRMLDEGMPRDELAPRETPDQVRILGVADEVWERVRTDLEARDLPVGALQPGFGDGCPVPEVDR